MKASTRKTLFAVIGVLIMLFGIIAYFIVTDKIINIDVYTFIGIEAFGALVVAGQIDAIVGYLSIFQKSKKDK